MFFPILEAMTFTEHDSAEAAVDALITMYDAVVELAEEALGSGNHELYRDVVYPKLIVDVKQWRPIDRTEPYGYVDHAGRYAAVLSRPRMMRTYLMDMLTRLVTNYPCDIYTCYSDIQVPPVFIDGLENTPQNIGGIGGETGGDSGDSAIPQPSLDFVDDGIVDSAWDAFHGDELPLFHFAPHRFDVACKRIEHYTGIPADGVQQFILFTNYAMHTTEFVKYGLAELVKGDTRYTHMLLPNGEKVTANNAATCEYNLDSRYQMPRYDLCTADGDGITIINIGVGPSNAKTITDCLAVLRPECWVMIGHCAGLDGRMRIGDLILGNAYQRRDHILDDRIGVNIPIPAVPEVKRALEASVHAVYGESQDLMRTGTVLSTDDRNWEWHTPHDLWRILRGSTAVAVDMESAALATNGYRYRIPYGTLLAVSDLPLHNVPKLPAAAQAFYSNSKEAHLMCAVRAMETLAANPEKLHTRKLRRTIGEVPFR